MGVRPDHQRRGVAVDLDQVRGALDCGEQVKRAPDPGGSGPRTGLVYTPNSVAQLTAWLADETQADVDNLPQEDTVTDLLAGDLPSDQARRVLEIRQELGRTSTKSMTPWPGPPATTAASGAPCSSMGPTAPVGGRAACCRSRTCPGPICRGIDAAREMVKGREVKPCGGPMAACRTPCPS